MAPHPTQIFMSNPQALRVEYRLDDQRLEIWWSPLAGRSTDCADRNYSSRDAHLDVFESITIPDCGLEQFQGCDYDPYHCVLHFTGQTLHLALRPDSPAVLLWGERPLALDFKAARHDEDISATPHSFAMLHREPRYQFEFAASVGPGGGAFRHGTIHMPGNCRFARAELQAGQLIVIAVSLADDGARARATDLAARPTAAHLAETAALLAPFEAMGRTSSSAHPELDALRRKVVRVLHSMIDESGAFRASPKSIYYLIWVRDGGFSFPLQSAAGWPHRLPEFCRLLLDNPTTVDEAGLPKGRMFGQLINRAYGRLEEDGLFYVVWVLFTQWSQTGHLAFLSGADGELLDEALAWVETMCWDESRGLYGEHFADETPTVGHRDCGCDFAIAKPVRQTGDGLHWQGMGVVRNYDIYFNMLMHSTYAMLAAMRGSPDLLRKAGRVWPELEKLLNTRNDGIPVYAEQTLADGRPVMVPHWGQANSCCVWGLAIPNFAPLPDWDAVLASVMDALADKPEMHFMNGICAAMAAVDPWLYPEDKLLAIHARIADETNRPGKFLPMAGAMPEKFAAPEGNLYHDIRPQGFAMGAWLAAWTALGLRRLPYGLALRPTKAFERIESYPWRGHTLDMHWGATGRGLALEVDGRTVPGTLQIPEARLHAHGRHAIRLVPAPERPLLLRSQVRLEDVEELGVRIAYHFTAFGLASLAFSDAPPHPRLTDLEGHPIPHVWKAQDGRVHTCFFTHFGGGVLSLG